MHSLFVLRKFARPAKVHKHLFYLARFVTRKRVSPPYSKKSLCSMVFFVDDSGNASKVFQMQHISMDTEVRLRKSSASAHGRALEDR